MEKLEGHDYNNFAFPSMPSQINSVVLDFEHMIFEINGQGIGHASEINISFYQGEWTISIGETACYNIRGSKIRG